MTAARWLVIVLCLPLLAAVRPAAVEPPATMWQVVSSANWNLTVRSIERQPSPLIAGDDSARPKGQFAIFTVDLGNRTGKELTPDERDFVLKSASGAISLPIKNQTAADAVAIDRGARAFGDPIYPGQTATRLLIFDIEPSAFPLTLTFVPARRSIKIDECSCSLPSPTRSL